MFAAIPLVQKIVGSIALAAIISLSLSLFMADRRADKWEGQSRKLSLALERISDAKDRQAETTKGTVAKARIIYRDADSRARRIEAAPLLGQCVTPEAVLQADL